MRKSMQYPEVYRRTPTASWWVRRVCPTSSLLVGAEGALWVLDASQWVLRVPPGYLRPSDR